MQIHAETGLSFREVERGKYGGCPEQQNQQHHIFHSYAILLDLKCSPELNLFTGVEKLICSWPYHCEVAETLSRVRLVKLVINGLSSLPPSPSPSICVLFLLSSVAMRAVALLHDIPSLQP